MKIISISNHSKKVRDKNSLYESYRKIEFNEDEIKLFKKKIKYLLKEFKIDIVDNDLKIFSKTIKSNSTRDNKVFNELDEQLEKKVQKAYQILKEYKEEQNT